MTTTHTLAGIAAICSRRISSYRKDLDKFQERMDVNPVYAFEWAEDAMHSAVRIQVLTQLKAWAESAVSEATPEGEEPKTEEEHVQFIAAYFESEALSKAGRIASSTSCCSNLMQDLERAYYVEVAGWLAGRFLCAL